MGFIIINFKFFFSEYLHEVGEDENFETFDNDHLANTLRSFYGSVHNKKKWFLQQEQLYKFESRHQSSFDFPAL